MPPVGAKEVGGVFQSLTSGLEGNALIDSLGPALMTRIINAQLGLVGPKAEQPQGAVIQQQTGPITAPQTQTNNAPSRLDYYELSRQR